MREVPAFPVPASDMQSVGLSLRHYFAAKALQGIEASQWNSGYYIPTVEKVAERAYDLADAMVKAGETKSEYRAFLEFMDHKHDAIRREITEQNLPSTDLLGQQCFFDWLRQCAREFEAKRIVQPTRSDSDE